ncbi:hypothetical protein PMIN03_006838 [Paraphaeosphaeria minitans]
MTFSSGCTSWFIDKNGHNSYVFPNYTFMFWLSTVMINWNQVQVDYPKNTRHKGKSTSKTPYALLLAGVAAAGLLATGSGDRRIVDTNERDVNRAGAS